MYAHDTGKIFEDYSVKLHASIKIYRMKKVEPYYKIPCVGNDKISMLSEDLTPPYVA